uniref:Uncharacterized protein n=1 Tax=Romanomermis culicivorax TaxID=13658 RepID=A0A915J154_ROMCU
MRTTPIQPAPMDAETTTATDQTLTDIPEESTSNQSTSMDVLPVEPATVLPPTAPAMDLHIYLATLAILTGPRIIATVAAARYSAPIRFSQHINSDLQWQTLAAALTMYHFASLSSGVLFPEHHWMDYPDVLKEEIQRVLQPQLTPAVPVPQIAQLAPAPSMSTLVLDRYGQPIRKPGHYEHSVKRKQHLQEEAEYRKSHKTHTTDEPHTKQMPPPNAWRTEHCKTSSK